MYTPAQNLNKIYALHLTEQFAFVKGTVYYN